MPSKAHIHKLNLRVYYEDTDAGGVVYHARYLAFAERGRTEWLRAIMGNTGPMWSKDDPVFAVRHMKIDFDAPARLDDSLTVTTCLTKLGGASFDMHQTIHRGETVLVTIKVVLVAVTHDLKVLRLPPEWRQTLSRFLVENHS